MLVESAKAAVHGQYRIWARLSLVVASIRERQSPRFKAVLFQLTESADDRGTAWFCAEWAFSDPPLRECKQRSCNRSRQRGTFAGERGTGQVEHAKPTQRMVQLYVVLYSSWLIGPLRQPSPLQGIPRQ